MNCREIWAASLCPQEDCYRLRGHSGACPGWIALPPPLTPGTLRLPA